MAIEKEAFRSYTLDEDKEKGSVEVISLKINADERKLIDICKKVLEQPKDATTIKTLAWIGSKVVLDEKTGYILGTIFKNKRNNNHFSFRRQQMGANGVKSMPFD